MTAFSELLLLYAGRKCYTEANTMSNSTIKLTKAAMVDNLAEKINECPLNRGR